MYQQSVWRLTTLMDYALSLMSQKRVNNYSEKRVLIHTHDEMLLTRNSCSETVFLKQKQKKRKRTEAFASFHESSSMINRWVSS